MKRLVIAALIGVALSTIAYAQLAVQITPQDIATANGSVTITTGNTFQQVLAAAAPTSGVPSSRRSLTIQNNNTADSCWIAFGTYNFGAGIVPITAANATKAISILLQAGGSYQRYSPYVPSDAIIATCTANSDTLYIDVQ